MTRNKNYGTDITSVNTPILFHLPNGKTLYFSNSAEALKWYDLNYGKNYVMIDYAPSNKATTSKTPTKSVTSNKPEEVTAFTDPAKLFIKLESVDPIRDAIFEGKYYGRKFTPTFNNILHFLNLYDSDKLINTNFEVSPFKTLYDKILGTVSYFDDSKKKPIFLNLNNIYLKNLSNSEYANVVLGNDFVEIHSNTVRPARDFRITTDTLLGDNKIPLSLITLFYGIEDGKLKIGNLDIFNDNTTVIPVRNKNIGKIKEVTFNTYRLPDYTKATEEKYPEFNSYLQFFWPYSKKEKYRNDKLNYYNYLARNKFPTKDSITTETLNFITENNDTIEAPDYFHSKLIFSDENGNSIFVNKLRDSKVRNLVNNYLRQYPLYPILIDNGRYSHYDLTGNVNGYVNPLNDKKDMFIIGY